MRTEYRASVRIRTALFVFFLFALAACTAGKPARQPDTVAGIAFNSMTWTVKVTALPQGMTAGDMQRQMQALLDDANKVLSTYQPDTELMRFNRSPVGEWVPVSHLLFDAVSAAVAVSEASSGASDITVGLLVNLWGFGPAATPVKTPTDAEIAALRARVGWQKIGINRERRALMRRADIQLDLSSVGEGVAVDALAAWLESHGVHDYMVSVAGCSLVKGKKPDGSGWVIAIEKPDGSGEPLQRLALQHNAVSTSGSYRNYREIDGVRYSHTIDPVTGRPISHHGVSVTVIMPDGNTTLADAWATAFNVLGPEKGLALADTLDMPVYFIEQAAQGQRHAQSRAFTRYLPPAAP